MHMTVATAVACLVGVGISTAHDAQAAITKETTIPPQGLGFALKQLANERDIQLVYRSEIVGERQTSGAVGELTFDEALAKLLEGTGLTYQYLDDRAVTIVPTSSGGRQRFRLAQAETASGSPAVREGSSPRSTTLEEVVVSAQRREEKLQDVPISISVLRGEILDRSTVQDVTEALSRVSGVSVQGSRFSGAQVQVRGVPSNGTINFGSSPTAYYLDGVPFGFAKHAFGPDADAYDLEQVDVLRGPQGTLYGASALSGVVRVLTREVDLDDFELKARGMTSSTEDGDWNYRGDAAVNVPIVEDKLAVRAVLGYQDLSGWIDKPSRNEENVNDVERSVARVKINAQPTDALSIGMSAWLSRADYGASPNALDSGGEMINVSPLDEPMSTDYDVYGLDIGYDFAAFTVSSATSYLDYTTHLLAGVGDRASGALTLDTTWDARTVAEEINLTSTHGGNWRWTLGGIYRDSEDTETSFLFPIFSTPRIARYMSKSYAVFGELTRLFADGKWEVTTGLRHFEDELTTREESRVVPEARPFVDSVATFTATTPRFVVTWHASDRITAYASYGEGFRSGFEQDFTAIGLFPPVQPDTLKNYEVGTKGTLAGGRLGFETALYYVDWQDVQQVVNVPHPIVPNEFTAGVINGESASGVGVDLAISARPWDALELGLNVGWNDLHADNDLRAFTPAAPQGVVLIGEGDRLPNSTEFTAGASADYTFPLGGSGFDGRFSVSANYTSNLSRPQLDGATVNVLSGDSLLVARTVLEIRAPKHWTVSLFIDNFTNEQGIAVPETQPDDQLRIRPRTIGMQFEYAW